MDEFLKKIIALAVDLDKAEDGFHCAMIVNEMKNEYKSHFESIHEELKATEQVLGQRQRVLDEIPECPVHGKCVEHAIEWVKKMKAFEKEVQIPLKIQKE